MWHNEGELYIVFLFCSNKRSDFYIKSEADSTVTDRTVGYIDTIGCDTQSNADHFGKVVIQDYVDKVSLHF